MDSLRQDLEFGARLLWKDWGFALTALVTLALCIGANVAIFSVVNAVLLRSLPYDEAEGIVLVYNSYPEAGAPRAGASAPDYFDRLEGTDAFEELAMFTHEWVSLGEQGTPQQVPGLEVTPSFFRLLRVEPMLGQAFTEEDGTVGNDDKAILSHAAWRQYFGGEAGVVGSDVRLDGVPHTVVGVMPPDIHFGSREVRVYRPIAFTDQQRRAYHVNDWQQIGRLRPGATIRQARQQINAVNGRNLQLVPAGMATALRNAGFGTRVVGYRDDLVRDVRSTLYLLWGGVLFVLLIGCVNIANLVMVRSNVRRRELATRLAFGASRWRVARQLVTESVVLTTVGGVAGLLLGHWGLQILEYLGMDGLPRAQEIRLDGTVALATLGLALLIGFLLGLIPVAHAIRTDIGSVFHEDGITGTSSVAARLVRRVLVTAQVAIALVLLIGAGLMLASFRQILGLDLGFETSNVLTGQVALTEARYTRDSELRAFVEQALNEVRAVPGVVAAGATSVFPLSGDSPGSVSGGVPSGVSGGVAGGASGRVSGGASGGMVIAEGQAMGPGESLVSPARIRVTPGYLEAMGIELIQGRYFDETDDQSSYPAVIVDRRLAGRLWPNAHPLGKRLYRPTDMSDLTAVTGETRFLNVVGVVEDVALRDVVREDGSDVGAYYVPYAQDPARSLTFAIETIDEPGLAANAVRAAFAAVDPGLPFFNVRTMEDRLAEALGPRRTPVVLAMGFAAVALFLAAVGVYGVLAYMVTTRTREIGIRITLGSRAPEVFRLVLQEGMKIVAVGMGLGLLGAYVLRSTLRSQLYGVEPLDAAVWLWVVGVLTLVALLACVFPARRATRVDPVVALRAE